MAGIEDVDELWSRLRLATERGKALAASNRELAARVASLERQLAESGALSDDELLAELPRRMGRALESAQEVAAELVGRAQSREEHIRQQTDQQSAALISHAEAEATAILRRAAGEAVARVNAAKAEAQAVLRSAQARHDQVVADLQQQSAALEDRVIHLRRQHSRLGQAYDLVARTLEEARGALRASIEISGSPPPQAPASPSRASERPGQFPGRQAPASPLRVVTNEAPPVFDWSPPASGSA
jgi:cell division septum initiation protein DivIVA